MTATLTHARPIEGPAYDKTRPESKQAWLDFRRPGLTATMIRDWGVGSRRREMIEEKITGESPDLSDLPYIAHGEVREPVIAEWIRGRFGIEPCNSVYAHPENTRHLASPDGVSLDPFTRELIVGTEGAVLAEIKTSKKNLMPGVIDAARMLVQVEEGSDFDRTNYYTQMQWQMYVMNATMTLFVWEQHDDKVDPETRTFTPIGPPEYVWIPRNQGLIDVLVEKVAPKALAEIDAALALKSDVLPPISDFPAEDAVLVADVLKARDRIAAAEAARDAAWAALNGKYVDDCKHDLGFATLTVSSGQSPDKVSEETYVDFEGMNAREKQQVERYNALIAKHTKTRPVVTPGKTYRKMTITAKKEKP